MAEMDEQASNKETTTRKIWTAGGLEAGSGDGKMVKNKDGIAKQIKTKRNTNVGVDRNDGIARWDISLCLSAWRVKKGEQKDCNCRIHNL